jgi:predicted nucleic acid-binding protein
MTAVVLDASAVLAWLLKSQRTARSQDFLVNEAHRDFLAPYILLWEVRNVLVAQERRGLLTAEDHALALALLDQFDIDIAPPLSDADLVLLTVFAQSTGLSLFDAGYLKMAVDLDCPVASRDVALVKAAADAGVTCFDFLGA